MMPGECQSDLPVCHQHAETTHISPIYEVDGDFKTPKPRDLT